MFTKGGRKFKERGQELDILFTLFRILCICIVCTLRVNVKLVTIIKSK